MKNVTVRTHHLSLSKAIKAHAEDKMGKLAKYFDNIQEIVVELDHSETADENKRNVASAIVRASGTVIKAKTQSKDMYAALDGLVEKVTTQLKKHKDKLRSPKRAGASSEKVAASAMATPSGKAKTPAKKAKTASKSTHKTVKDPIFVKKPMHPEDAAAVLEEKKVKFLVFRNLENHQISVLYPLENGEFGLIETE